MVDLLERLQAALADRYAVEREIGRGGMATVFLAEDLKHHRKGPSRSCIRSSPPPLVPTGVFLYLWYIFCIPDRSVEQGGTEASVDGGLRHGPQHQERRSGETGA